MNPPALSLGLGAGRARFEPPPDVEWQVVAAREPVILPGISLDEADRAIEVWLEAALDGASPGEIAVAVPDLTRPSPTGRILSALRDALARRGAPAGPWRVIVATGTHQPPSERSLREIWQWHDGAALTLHDPDRSGSRLGKTRAGTEVEIDSAFAGAETRLTLGAVSFHYFAGFGGGPKMVFPGLASRRGTMANHRRALAVLPPGGLAEGCAPGRVRGNPVAEDIAEAAALCPASSLACVRFESGWRLFAGPGAQSEARRAVSERGAVGEPAAYDVVVASAGGAPLDVDLVQAHKALVHASGFVREGGSVVLLAATPAGSGSRSFERWLGFSDLGSLEEAARAGYDLNAQTAISFRRLVGRHGVFWVGSEAEEWVRRAGAEPCTSVEEAWEKADRAARASGRLERGAILPVATEVVPAS